MSRKSTFTNTNISDIQVTGITPEFEQWLLQNGYTKQNQDKNQSMDINIQSSVSPIASKNKIKATITNKHPIESTYTPHMPVQAIPTEYIQKAKDYFRNPHSRYHMNDIRDFLYFILSINTARRAGDILNLKTRDVIDEDGSIREHMIIHEQKTGKLARVKLNYKAKEALVEYINSKENIDMNDYLFQNYKTGDKLTVDGARKIVKKMVKAIGLDETGLNFGTHSLRKTWCKQAIDNNPNNSKAELTVSQALNHSSISATRHYINRTQEEMDKFFENNAL